MMCPVIPANGASLLINEEIVGYYISDKYMHVSEYVFAKRIKKY